MQALGALRAGSGRRRLSIRPVRSRRTNRYGGRAMTGSSAIVSQPKPGGLEGHTPPFPGTVENCDKTWAGPEKRRQRRYATCDPVDVFLLDFARMRICGILRDVSRDGFRVEIDFPVQRGSRLKLKLRNHTTVFAVTRYCRRTGDCYHVGAEIEWLYCATNPEPPIHVNTAQSANADAAHTSVHE